MKTQVLFFVVGLVLLSLSYSFGHKFSIANLPGSIASDNELIGIFAASTNPSGTGSGLCTVTCGVGCSASAGAGAGTTVGASCGGESFTGSLANISCTGGPSTQRFVPGTEECVTPKTVKVCQYSGTILKCSGTGTISFLGTRTTCKISGSLPHEP